MKIWKTHDGKHFKSHEQAIQYVIQQMLTDDMSDLFENTVRITARQAAEAQIAEIEVTE